jgi:RimJ/RimL family protein N-acetyltransferase
VSPLPPTRIETDRLVLRCWRREDAALLKEAVDSSLEELQRWLSWALLDPRDLALWQYRLQRKEADFAEGTDFEYGVFDRGESRVLGGSGLHARIGPGALGIGYWVRSDSTNRGLATEAPGVTFRTDGVVTLDRFNDEDAPALLEVDGDPAHRLAFDFPVDFVPSLEHSRRVIDGWHDEFASGSRLAFAVRDRTSGTLLGGCELRPKGSRTNLSYWTHPAHRNAGVASRAVALACRVAFDDLHIERLEIVTAPGNAASRRVAVRSGFREAGVRDGLILHVLDRADHGRGSV